MREVVRAKMPLGWSFSTPQSMPVDYKETSRNRMSTPKISVETQSNDLIVMRIIKDMLVCTEREIHLS